MSSNKKRFSLGLAVGLSLGLAGGAAYAGNIDDTYTTGGTLTATMMDNIKNAVNDNNTGKGVCVGNPAVTGDTMVRVGSTCVDKYQARADFTGCSVDGNTGCAAVTAQSTSTGTAASDMSWAQAARACANAGKRLLSPGEWFVARSFGSSVVSGAGMFTICMSQCVDSVALVANLLAVGRMGANIGSAGSGEAGYQTVDVPTDLGGATVGFRCAR